MATSGQRPVPRPPRSQAAAGRGPLAAAAVRRRRRRHDPRSPGLNRLLPLMFLAGCAAAGGRGCRPMLEAQLLFGLTDEATFTAFLDR